MASPGLRRTGRRVFGLAGAAALLFVLVILTKLAWYVGAPLRVAAEPRPSDVISLFSSGQIDDHWLTIDEAQRLLGALDLYRRHFAPVIVTSGSQHDQGDFQAELEAAWLREAGVPQDALVVENRSTRTYDSVLALQRLMREHGWSSVVIVTSRMDVPRIAMVCRHLGMRASFLAAPLEREPTSWLYLSEGYPLVFHAMYEYAAIVLYWWNGWI